MRLSSFKAMVRCGAMAFFTRRYDGVARLHSSGRAGSSRGQMATLWQRAIARPRSNGHIRSAFVRLSTPWHRVVAISRPNGHATASYGYLCTIWHWLVARPRITGHDNTPRDSMLTLWLESIAIARTSSRQRTAFINLKTRAPAYRAILCNGQHSGEVGSCRRRTCSGASA